MLQQTQVERVVPKYKAWIARWTNWASLARATDRELLAMWSGLGYNRRALYLGRIARIIIDRFGGKLPEDPETLKTLPGIGPYTSNAILIFAFNRPLVTIDTNIRRVLLREFDFPASAGCRDLEPLARALLPKGRSRDWHHALMDYSRAALPRSLPEIPPISRQSRYKGSLRQIRGEIIRRLTMQSRISINRIASDMNRLEAEVRKAALALEKDGFVIVGKKYIRLR